METFTTLLSSIFMSRNSIKDLLENCNNPYYDAGGLENKFPLKIFSDIYPLPKEPFRKFNRTCHESHAPCFQTICGRGPKIATLHLNTHFAESYPPLSRDAL
ncbi:hypothetical protein CEXT_733851 [Caerostris extrusa]|uniref:Uncharacterized protein n=1 Tax=Caerostris extrusa TaxID=172846 RepID=A0AAV4UZG8_CAEEX|nr:hypothetical protein CEXT_733851 [Caerostris extrusa]